MHAFTANRVEINRKRCHQGFTFTRAHLGDFTFVQGDTPDELYIVVTHTKDTAWGFTTDRKGFR